MYGFSIYYLFVRNLCVCQAFIFSNHFCGETVVTKVSDINQSFCLRKKRRIKKGRLVFFALIVCALLLLVCWSLLNGLRVLVFKSMADVQTLKPGVVSQQSTVEGILIKQEYLITAPLKGTLKFSVADGQRIKGGATLATVSAPSMEAASGLQQYALKAPVSGVFSRHVDNFETILVPKSLGVVQLPTLDKIESNYKSVQEGPVDSGQSVAKVVDNLAPMYIYATVSETELNKIKKLNKSFVDLSWQGQDIEAKVDKIGYGNRPQIILSIRNYPDGLVHLRRTKFSVKTDVLEGLLVSDKSLVTRDGQTGLYLVWKGMVRWTPVEVAGRLQGQVAIKGKEIQPGLSYVTNPFLAREGDRI